MQNSRNKDKFAFLENVNFKNGKHLKDLFYNKAKDVATSNIVTSTQFRKFYDEILKLVDEALNQGLNEKEKQEEFEDNILPLLYVLISKASYAEKRNRDVNYKFVVLFEKSIKKIKTFEELKNFKLFLESIIGFMKK